MLTRGLFVPFSVARVAAFWGNWPSGGREGAGGRAREQGRERAELFQRPGHLSLHEVNAAGGRLDGNEWYASLGVTTVIGAAVCLQAPTHSLVSSRRCWRHTRHSFWNLKASLTLCFVIFFFFFSQSERFSCVYVLSIFPRHCDCSSK